MASMLIAATNSDDRTSASNDTQVGIKTSTADIDLTIGYTQIVAMH